MRKFPWRNAILGLAMMAGISGWTTYTHVQNQNEARRADRLLELTSIHESMPSSTLDIEDNVRRQHVLERIYGSDLADALLDMPGLQTDCGVLWIWMIPCICLALMAHARHRTSVARSCLYVSGVSVVACGLFANAGVAGVQTLLLGTPPIEAAAGWIRYTLAFCSISLGQLAWLYRIHVYFPSSQSRWLLGCVLCIGTFFVAKALCVEFAPAAAPFLLNALEAHFLHGTLKNGAQGILLTLCWFVLPLANLDGSGIFRFSGAAKWRHALARTATDVQEQR